MEKISNIKYKLQKLILQYQQLKQENNRQAIHISSIEKKLDKSEILIENLKQELASQKQHTQNILVADKKIFETKLDVCVKEIDKALSLLNNK